MADAVVEQSPTRFFCHRCLLEFEDVMQDFTCPYCEGGFIEELVGSQSITMSGDYSDADMSNIDDLSNLDDSDEVSRVRSVLPAAMNDLAFLVSGARQRARAAANGTSGSSTTSASSTHRRPTLVEELVYMIGGSRAPSGSMTAGAPFVLVGTPGDYVFGGEGLDAVVTQLLGQLEHSGPPPLPRDKLEALPTEQVTEEQAKAKTACSVCWDNFELGETTSRLVCEHVFHQKCITPWLQLHATCPICRRSLLPPEERTATAAVTTAGNVTVTTSLTTTTTTTATPATTATPPTTATPATTATPGTPTPAPPLTPMSAPILTRMSASPFRPVPAPPLTPMPVPILNSNPDLRLPIRSSRVLIRRGTGYHPGLIRRFQAHWDSINDTSTSSSPASSITSAGVWAPQNRSNSSTGSNSSSLNDRDRQFNMDMDFD